MAEEQAQKENSAGRIGTLVFLTASERRKAARAGSISAGIREALATSRIIEPPDAIEIKKLRHAFATVQNSIRSALAAGADLTTADRIQAMNCIGLFEMLAEKSTELLQ